MALPMDKHPLLFHFSIKPVLPVDKPIMMCCLSMKSSLPVDKPGMAPNLSTKTAFSVEKPILFRKQFFDYGKVKFQNSSDLLVGSVIIEVQMSCSLDSLFRIKERYFTDTIFLAYM